MTDIRMPKLSDSMQDGTVVRWLVEDGGEVRSGDALAEIETDKATITYEAESDGRLSIELPEGATAAVGVVIGHLDGAVAAEAVTNGAATTPRLRPHVIARSGTAAGAPRAKASPVARRIAAQLGVDLAVVAGSGPRGRIVRRDVEMVAARPGAAGETAQTEPLEPTSAAIGGKGAVEVTPATHVQRTIAQRMGLAKSTMPDFSLTIEVAMDAAVALRSQLQAVAPDLTPSYNDMVIKSCALALRRHPRANGCYRDDAFHSYSRVNIGVAVAAEGSLLVPVVSDADVKSLGALAAETRRLAGAARAGTLHPAQLSDATFTVSNLGMFGISSFTAVLNPPQAAILAVGAVEQRAVAVAGELAVGHRMTVTMTCDHRILYGADAAAVLGDIRDQLEQPLRLIL